MWKPYLKNCLFVFAACFLLTGVNAAEGDTIRISSHQETHWSWYGSHYDTVQFPATGSYRRILMYYTLGCPSIGCSEWDYTTQIEISDPVDDTTTHWFELVRIITPYAGDKNANWKHTWVIDVTDYAPLFTGERAIHAFYSGYQDGFTVSIDFDFIEGTPPRNVLDVYQLYHGAFRYGFTSDPIEDHLVPVDIAVDANTETAKFRMVASGHSFGGNENCAEFCEKFYQLYVDGTKVTERTVWRDDCGSNPLEGQTGTWIYERAGWCPGAETMRYDDEVGNYLDPGQSNEFNVNWQNYVYTGGAGFDPQYIIEAQVFQYAPWNHNLDLAIDDVLKPSLNDQVWDVNPICNNPQIVVSNAGAEFITKAKFEYWTEGAPFKMEHTWTGILAPGQSAVIDLPSSDWKLFGGKTDNVFYVEVKSVNNLEDDYAANNLFASRFEEPEVFPSKIVIAFNNNGAANEVSYRVLDYNGDEVFSRNTASASTSYQDTVSLDTGCYTLLVEDSDCDGLSFFANSDGNGRIWLHDADPDNFFPPLHQFDPEFGCETQLSFTVGYTLGIDDVNKLSAPILLVYPNPSSGDVTFTVKNGFEPGELNIYDLHGHLVQHITLRMNGSVITDLASGVYNARFSSDQGSVNTRFVITR